MITSVTRLAVHTSPRASIRLCVVANSAGICAFWSAVNRELTPLGGCALPGFFPSFSPSAGSSGSPLRALTPNALAMSFCCQPSSFSFHARFRRSSRQPAAPRCSHASYCLILDFFLSRSIGVQRHFLGGNAPYQELLNLYPRLAEKAREAPHDHVFHRTPPYPVVI